MKNVVGEVGGFAEKLKKAKADGYIASRHLEVLQNVVEVGHPSAHRGYFPSIDELRVALEVVKHLLRGQYVLLEGSRRLVSGVPKRKKRL